MLKAIGVAYGFSNDLAKEGVEDNMATTATRSFNNFGMPNYTQNQKLNGSHSWIFVYRIIFVSVIKACDQKPNCVSSTDHRPAFAINALPYKGDMVTAKESFIKLIVKMPRRRLVGDHGPYLHFEFTSKWFRFVDDVEFFFDEKRRQIDMRSASRVGNSDLGANRKRLLTITKQWAEILDQTLL